MSAERENRLGQMCKPAVNYSPVEICARSVRASRSLQASRLRSIIAASAPSFINA